MTTRSYGQYCGLARALDVVGNRWNLLIVRQLLIAPARYQELLEGLPGVATNLLADRLRDLETAGVIERQLAGTGSAVRYALTPWGAELRESVEGLIRWSTPLMIRGPEGDRFRADSLLLALPALFAGRTPSERAVRVGFSVDGELVQLNATPAGISVAWPDGQELDAVLTGPAQLVLGLATGLLSLDDVHAFVDVQGDEAAVRAIMDAPRHQPGTSTS